MKTIGIVGGMSCESTALYYERLNAQARARLGGLHSAECVIWSVDFAEIEEMQASGDWAAAAARLVDVARRLEDAGAEVLVLATNTMHKVADAIESVVTVPFVHIADATADAIVDAEFSRPGLMATAYTMEQDFYVGRIRKRYGLDVRVPGDDDRAETHRIIYDELCKGVRLDESRDIYRAIARRLVEGGADSLILGCTEVGMLLGEGDVAVPVFDTTLIHADRALDLALAQ